jgi:tetratricopeptide (TPR) repeat protein
MNATDVPAPAVGSGRDGQLLQGRRLGERFEGSEDPAVVLTSERGIEHERDDETKMVAPGEGYLAVATITDERVLLIVGGNSDEQGNPDRSVSLPYTEIRSVESRRGVLKSRLTITARTSDRYHFLVGGRESFDEVEATVRRAINHWVAVDRRLGKAKEHLSTIEDHLEATEPRAAADAYRRTRELLDEARDVAAQFREGTHAMHRRIEQVETRLAMTQIHGHEIRAEQHVETAEAARERGDFEAAFAAYQSALEQYGRGETLAADVDHHGTEAFEHRKREVMQALAQIKTGPIVSAMDACEVARETEDPSEAVDAWQSALRTCHDALVLVHGDSGFDGDYDALRCQVEWAVGELLDAHRRVIDRAESRGDDRADERPDAAAEAYRVALGHAESAAGVASEFRAGDPARFRAARDRLREKRAAVSDEV